MRVNDFVGIPFKELGRTIEGCDCWGLTVMGLKGLYGIDIKELASLEASGDHIPEAISEVAKGHLWKRRESAESGLVVLMFDRAMRPGHIGLCISPNKVLHTTASKINRIGQSVITIMRAIDFIYPHKEFYEYVS